MSDRSVFVTAFLTVVLIVAGAFTIQEYFLLELAKSLMYVVVAVMIFFGEDQFSYMLGILVPPLSFILHFLLGGFFDEFRVLWDSLLMRSTSKTDTPLHGLAILTELLLIALCLRAWRKQVPEKFFGKTFGICLAISIVYIGILAGMYYHAFPAGGRMP